MVEERCGFGSGCGGSEGDVVHLTQFLGRAEQRDGMEEGVKVGARDGALLPLLHHPATGGGRFRSPDREQDARDLPAIVEAAGKDRRKPGPLKLAGRKPNGIVEGVVARMIDDMKRQRRGARRFGRGGLLQGRDGRQRPHPLEAHGCDIVVDGRGEEVDGPEAAVGAGARLPEPIGPVDDDSGCGGPGAGVGRGEHPRQKRSVDRRSRAVVEPLAEPEKLEAAPFEAAVVAGGAGRGVACGGGPGVEIGADLVDPPLDKDTPGSVTGPALGGEHIDQLAVGELRGIEARHERPSLRCHAPDSTMRAVAAVVAEVDFPMLDDRVVPIGDVDRPVGPHLHVDRPEVDAR